MDHHRAEIHELLHRGDWDQALPLLRAQPELVNVGTPIKGYTALHQAAWHGAPLAVVGELLALGADRCLATFNKRQSAAQIAAEIHPGRLDLAFLLDDSPRTMAQLMRKLVADEPSLFTAYDGSHILFDRIVDAFGVDLFAPDADYFAERISAAIHAVLGELLPPGASMKFGINDAFEFQCDADIWTGRITDRLGALLPDATSLPIERSWAVIGDLFLPSPEQWGTRGDVYLWLEMQQALCHVALSETEDILRRMLEASFLALTGFEIFAQESFFVKRFDRGGMSSGQVSPETWRRSLIPLLHQRAQWLRESWSWDRR